MICFHLVCSLVLLTACWDQVAIEKRGFVIGTSVDIEEMGDKKGKGLYTLGVTSQIVVPAGLWTSGQGGAAKKAFTNVSASGSSLFEISRVIAKRTSRIPYYEHLKVVVVSEELAMETDLFASIMDVFIRDLEMRQSIKLMISEEEAKSILEVVPEEQSLPAMYINSIMENNSKSLEIVDPVIMSDVHGFLLNRSSYIIPRVLIPEENEIQPNGVAVFHGTDNKMVGVLDGEETKGLNLLKNKNSGGYIEFKVNDHLMVYEIQKTNSTIKIDAKDKDHINISVSIDAEGAIEEMFGSSTLFTPKRIERIEKKVSSKIEQLANRTLKKAQQEYNADIFGYDKMLKQRHYGVWKKIKEDWDHGDNLFQKCDITVTANAIVRSTGSTDRTKNKGNE